MTKVLVPILGRCVEMSALRANGCRFPVELTINRIYSDGPISYTGFVRDISLRKDAEYKLNQLHDELEQRVLDRTCEMKPRTATSTMRFGSVRP